MKNTQWNWFPVIAGIIIALVSGCSNPFFPAEKEMKVNSPRVPHIASHPQSAVYDTGDEALKLSVSATARGKGKLLYQWYSNTLNSNKGGTKIAEATTADYQPSTDVPGTVYYYVVVTNVLYKKTARAVSDTAKIEVHDIKGKTPVTNVDITVTSPMMGAIPDTTAHSGGNFIIRAVSWNPDHAVFQSSTIYTVTVTITANENHVFAEELSAKINGHEAAISHNDGDTVILSLTFDATLTKMVTGISIKDQPAKLIYTHGETLDLTGLAITFTFNDAASENVMFADFGTNISTNPVHGSILSCSTHNGQPVAVSYGDFRADTDNLTVNKTNLFVTWPDGLTAVYGQTLSDISLASYTNGGTGTFTWTTPNALVGDPGSRSHNMTFTPSDSVHYNTVQNDVTITVYKEVGFSIGFTADYAPDIIGPTIHRSNLNGNTTKTLEVDNYEQYDEGSIKWRITGTGVTGTGPAFTLDSTNTAYNSIGNHFLMVEVKKNGVSYNRTVIFTVAP